MSKTIIEANKSNFSLNLKELFEYRELLFMLSYRDFRVRYAHTFLGVLWAIIQPLFTLLIFSLLFGRAIKVDTSGIPYPLYAMSGILAWNYFSFVVSQAGNSIISAQALVTKVYFPRLIIPFSRSVIGLIDLTITLTLTFLLILYYGVYPAVNVIFLPLLIIVLITASLSVGIWLSALTIRYRDVQHIIPFIVQMGLYISPVAYPSTVIPEKYLIPYYINPMAGITDAFRWCFFNIPLPYPEYLLISLLCVLLLFISGVYYFRSIEKSIADII